MDPQDICFNPNDEKKEIPFKTFSEVLKYLYIVPFEKIAEEKEFILKRA